MALKEEGQNMTDFNVPMGLYKRKRPPIELVSAAVGIQIFMQFVFSGLP